MQTIKNVFFLLPIMGYLLVESFIIAIFTSFIWNFFLINLFRIEITYIQWVSMIWIIKIVFFDVFKLISVMNNTNKIDE